MPLVVASINIKHCERAPAMAIARVLSEHGVQVAAIQEVDRGMSRSGHVDQPAVLAAESGLGYSAFVPTTRKRRGAEYGILLLSAIPVTFEAPVLLPRVGREEKRIAQVALLHPGSGPQVRLIHTHLSVDGDSAEAQIRYIEERLLSDSVLTILAGDLNGAHVPAGLQEDDVTPTWPSESPRVRLDHVAVSEDLSAGSVEWGTLCMPGLTDHCMVVATLGLTPADAGQRERASSPDF